MERSRAQQDVDAELGVYICARLPALLHTRLSLLKLRGPRGTTLERLAVEAISEYVEKNLGDTNFMKK